MIIKITIMNTSTTNTITTMSYDEIDELTIDMADMITVTKSNKLYRTYNLKMNDKNIYFRTGLLEPGSMKLFKQYKYPTFSFATSTTNADMTNKITCITDKLNLIRRTLIGHVVCLTKIPDTHINQPIKFIVNTTKDEKLFNILHYDNKTCNLDIYDTANIIKYCNCDFIIQIISFVITENRSYVKCRMSRICPESLDNIPVQHNKSKILAALHTDMIDNVKKLDALDRIISNTNSSQNNKYCSKKQVQNELLRLIA